MLISLFSTFVPISPSKQLPSPRTGWSRCRKRKYGWVSSHQLSLMKTLLTALSSDSPSGAAHTLYSNEGLMMRLTFIAWNYLIQLCRDTYFTSKFAVPLLCGANLNVWKVFISTLICQKKTNHIHKLIVRTSIKAAIFIVCTNMCSHNARGERH